MLDKENRIELVNKAKIVLLKNGNIAECFNNICNEYIDGVINIESLLYNIVGFVT